jgi:hypothetical protein
MGIKDMIQEFMENPWFQSKEFKPSVAYRPLSFRTNNGLALETFLLIDQQNYLNRSVRVYVQRKIWPITVKFDDITQDFKQFIPRMLYELDSKLYMNAIFPVKNSKYEAILILKHNDVLKYCLTGEITLDTSVRI